MQYQLQMSLSFDDQEMQMGPCAQQPAQAGHGEGQPGH